MPAKAGPSIVTNGLVLGLNGADRNSYPGTGTAWYDLSGYKNHATAVGSPTYNSTGFFIFDGTAAQDDEFTCNDSPSLRMTSAYTIGVWFKQSKPNSGLGLITKGPFENDYDYMMYLTTSGTKINTYYKNVSATVESTDTIDFSYNTTNWHYGLVSVNAAASQASIFYDGTFVYDNTLAVSSIRTSSELLRIARGWSTGDSGSFGGSIAAVQIYNRKLTDSEVKQNYEAQKSRFGI